MRYLLAGWLRDLAHKLDPTSPFILPFGGPPIHLAFSEDEDYEPVCNRDSERVLEELRLTLWCFEHEGLRRYCDHKHCYDHKCQEPMGHAPPHVHRIRPHIGPPYVTTWTDDDPPWIRRTGTDDD